MNPGSDHQLGQKIGALIATQSASNLPESAILSHVQDLLGADTALQGPLRDLLVRPAYRQLFTGGQRSVQVGGRDALLQDLANTYNPAVVARLAALIDGSLGLPPGPLSSVPNGASADPMGSRGYGAPGSAAGPWAAPYSQPQTPPPPSWAAAPATPPYSQPAPVAPPVAPAAGPSPVTALLIALVSLLTGAVLLGLGWALLSSRTLSPTPSASAPASSSPASPSPTPSTAPPPTPKGSSTAPQTPSSGAWGSASDYKFGQLPGGDFPNSCAFSVTDGSGRTTTDKSSLEYWACRDVGGDPDNGYKVVWADGKETTYTFQANGDGRVVGTNGNTYPMRWRNDSHAGEQIIVINHQDGAITWIPGHIE